MQEQDQHDALSSLPPMSKRKAMVTKTYGFEDGRRMTEKRLAKIKRDEEVAGRVIAAMNGGVRFEEAEIDKYTGY